MSKTEPLTIFPEEKIIIFGKNGLKKHALDSDIIASAIISMFVMTSMEISSTDNLSNELKGIIYGISYYLSCVLSQKSIFASSVLNFDISVLDDKVTNRNNKENISQKVATFFWHLESALKANVTNTLLVNSVFYMNRSSSLNDFILKMLQFDEFFSLIMFRYILPTRFCSSSLFAKRAQCLTSSGLHLLHRESHFLAHLPLLDSM